MLSRYEAMCKAYETLEKAFENYKHKVTPNNKLKRQGLPMRRRQKWQRRIRSD